MATEQETVAQQKFTYTVPSMYMLLPVEINLRETSKQTTDHSLTPLYIMPRFSAD